MVSSVFTPVRRNMRMMLTRLRVKDEEFSLTRYWEFNSAAAGEV